MEESDEEYTFPYTQVLQYPITHGKKTYHELIYQPLTLKTISDVELAFADGAKVSPKHLRIMAKGMVSGTLPQVVDKLAMEDVAEMFKITLDAWGKSHGAGSDE